MAVFTHKPMTVEPSTRWRFGQVSHLSADSISELHAFAEKIGVKRCYYSNKRGKYRPHYDLSPAGFQRAVDAGAEVMGLLSFVQRLAPIYNPAIKEAAPDA